MISHFAHSELDIILLDLCLYSAFLSQVAPGGMTNAYHPEQRHCFFPPDESSCSVESIQWDLSLNAVVSLSV